MNAFSKMCVAVDCPHCGAPIGTICDKKKAGVQRTFCYDRFQKADELRRSQLTTRHTTLDLVLAPVYNKGSNPSKTCLNNDHSKCSGFCRPKYGLRLQCTCHCHDKERKQCI